MGRERERDRDIWEEKERWRHMGRERKRGGDRESMDRGIGRERW